ncbi:MAG: hypothetical protein ABFR63_06375, partial [Thermodesulfobacteriota bacterium]
CSGGWGRKKEVDILPRCGNLFVRVDALLEYIADALQNDFSKEGDDHMAQLTKRIAQEVI